MANDAIKVEDLQDDDDLGADPEETDTTDWKAEALKARGIAKRKQTKLDKAREKLTSAEAVAQALAKKDPVAADKKGFGYAELAYLTAKGISEDDEVEFVEKTAKETGKELRELLGTKWFQAELKDMRDAKAAKDAVPSASKRSSTSSRDSVEYWIAKGELPPADQVDLRRKVVNAKIKAEKDKNTFTDHSVV